MTVQTSKRSERENRVLLHTTWRGYLKMLEAIGDSKVRVTYDRGRLEIMTTSNEHELVKTLLADLVSVLLQELDIGYIKGGSPTFKRELRDRGLEPDDCFWIQSASRRLAEEVAAEDFTPPDLALEIDVSRSMLNRLGIYAGLGIPEVWRWKAGHVQVYRLLEEGTYERCVHSPAVPKLPLSILREHISLRHTQMTSEILRRFRHWVREHLKTG
ncbi:MAG TPA: Uma2 family endonuclease [Candidatus Xenobia bacterium]|jgi:Uma2 family endonuclease